MPKNTKHMREDLPSLSGQEEPEWSKDDCVDTIRELAEENPNRRVTRDFFRKNTDIPERVWTGYFGTFPEFLKGAGIQYDRYENRVRLRIGQHASVDEMREISEKRKSYGNNYVRENNKRFKTMVACADLHDKECDPFYLRVLEDTVRNVQPDVICIDGDLFDIPEFGKYTVDPREWDTVGRINAGLDIIGLLREAAPDAQMDLIEGNHEARLIKHVAESSPALRAILADMHGFDVAKLFGLDKFEVNYVAKGDLFTFTDHQMKKETYRNFKVYWDCLLAHHFTEGRKYGLPGFNGHHHKHIVWSEHNAKLGSYEWHQMGGGHMRDASYTDGMKWNNGFLIANVDTRYESVNFDYTYVGETMAVSGGTWYYRESDEFYPALQHEMQQRNFNPS